MKLLLIDGHSLAYRAFYALPPLSNSSGTPTNAILGMVNMTLKILQDEKPTHAMIFFDRETPAFRLEMYEEYKATRKPAPDEFHAQLPLIEEFFRILRVPVVSLPGYEADDWIAAVAKQAEGSADEILILTGDLDLLQLVNEKTIVLASKRGTSQFTRYTIQEVQKRYGLLPEQLIDLKSLVGDASDNIKGVPGIGLKTAADILLRCGLLRNAFEQPEEIPEKWRETLLSHREQIKINENLVTLRSDAPILFHPDECAIPPFDSESLREFFQKLEFKKLLSRLESRIPSTAAVCSVPFQLVESEEALEKMLRLFQECKKASLLIFPPPTPFLNEHFLAVNFPEGENFVVQHKHFTRTLGQMAGARGEKEIAAYNWKNFELFFQQEKIRNPNWNVQDVFITGWLCNTLRTNPSLPELAQDYLGSPASNKIPENLDEMPPLLAEWASLLSRLGPLLKTKIQTFDLQEVYEKVEFPLVPVLAAMERNGVAIDLPYLQNLAKKLNEDLARLEGEIYREAGVIFNLNSPKQLAEILYQKLLLPKGKKTKGKTAYSTSVDELERLAEHSTVASSLLQYRELAKLQNTYVEVFPKLINPLTRRLHTTYVQTGTATGRLSSKEPNLQNIPIRTAYGKKIRQAFVAGKSGHKILSADYSQIELRLLAHFSRDPALIEAFQKQEDIHTRTACEVFNVSPESVTSEMRRMAKVVNFGIIYGVTEHGLSQSLGIKREEAGEYIKRYLSRFPEVETYIQTSLDDARRSGATRTLLGRLRFVPNLSSQRAFEREQAERIGINAPLQGSSADLIKLAMIRMQEKLSEKYETLMVLQVHDELVFEVPISEEKEIASLVKEEMEGVMKLDVPLEVEVSSGENWALMERIEFEKKR